MKSIAVIGVGMMGRPIAHRLIDAGYAVTVCDASEAQLEEFAQAGVPTTARPADCATSDAVLVLVNTAAQLREVVRGVAAPASGAAQPLVVVMSTVAPDLIVDLSSELRSNGVSLVDAPVSGGDQRAAEGKLTVMLGGAEADVARLRPVLESFSNNIFHCGPLGAGSTVKALNNVVGTLNSIASAEVLRLAQASGIAAEDVAAVLEVSTGRNFLTADPGRIREYYERYTTTRELWESILALLKKDAEAAKTLADADPGTYRVIAALPRLLATLGSETFDNWVAASGKGPVQ